MSRSRLHAASALLPLLLGAPALGQVTQRVSLTSEGWQANDDNWEPRITPDGRWIVFSSEATNLVPNDTNGAWDVLVRDRRTGHTGRVSANGNDVQGNGDSYMPSITPDGRYVTFSSVATNFVPGDTNGAQDVFVRDRVTGSIEIVSVDSIERLGNGNSFGGGITPDGRFVTIYSFATNLVPGDTNASLDVFVRDRWAGTTERVSVDSQGGQANGHSDNYPAPGSISDDGRFVAFQSCADDLVPGDANQAWDVFVRDRQLGLTERVGVASNGAEADQDAWEPVLSADGRFVAFSSAATNLVPNDGNAVRDVFVRDRLAGTTEIVSVSSGGTQANAPCLDASISADGRFVAFQSAAFHFAAGDWNGAADVFLRDRLNGTTELVSLTAGGTVGSQLCQSPFVSTNGRFVAFGTICQDFVPGDTNGSRDIIVRDRNGAPTFVEMCDPGTGGVVPCPCGNAPSGPGRGCDNSASTGGAVLFATGGTFLSSDTLVLHTRSQLPSTLSIVSQWNGALSSGAAFGMGVRCGTGHVERLYMKVASAGGIVAPDFANGDPPVSLRSADRGELILAGQSRWYVVYYRDPVVLGGCASTDKFNATQTGQVTWSP